MRLRTFKTKDNKHEIPYNELFSDAGYEFSPEDTLMWKSEEDEIFNN